jgi:zinc transport system substrate-binding protein
VRVSVFFLPFILLLSQLLLFTGCSKASPEKTEMELSAETKVKVYVSILPQKYFLERIGGERVSVEVLVLPGRSPATYEPTPRQMATLAGADVYFRIGVPFENAFLPKIQEEYPDLLIVDTREGIKLRPVEGTHDDTSGQDDIKVRGEPDPHIWLSPRRVMIQAATIRNALMEVDPAGAQVYKEGYRSFLGDLNTLDERLSRTFDPFRGGKIFVYHPSYGYFAEDYGLRQLPLEIEGKEPTPRQLAAYIEEAKREGVEIIFVQPEFSTRSARTVAREIGGIVVPVSILGEDYLKNLEGIAEAVEQGVK